MSNEKRSVSREDFVFALAYHEDTAIVDRATRSRLKKKSSRQLAAEGQFKAAVASAIYADSEKELNDVLEVFNRDNAKPLSSIDHLKRMFGIQFVPPGITKVKPL